jgi:hypothetical protein
MRQLWSAALGVLLATGCPKTAPSGPAGAPLDFDERQACTADADCAPVETGCCDWCNGGTPMGVHRDHAADVRQEYAKTCAGTACTAMACEPLVAICRDQRCGVVVNGVERVVPLPRK